MTEPRRSGRSTKGQNSRLSDIGLEVPSPTPATSAPKSKKTKATPPPPPSTSQPPAEPGDGASDEQEDDASKEENAPEDIIRCVCGAKEEDEDRDRMMIQCDGCDAWQHTVCMLIPRRKIPKEYFCEVCKPDNHQVLLEQMARGEKPWEKKTKKAAPKPKKEIKEHTPVRTSSRSARKASTPAQEPKEAVAPLVQKTQKGMTSAEPAPPPATSTKPERPDKNNEKAEKGKVKESERGKGQQQEQEQKQKQKQEQETNREQVAVGNSKEGKTSPESPPATAVVQSPFKEKVGAEHTVVVAGGNEAPANGSLTMATPEDTKLPPAEELQTPVKPKGRKDSIKEKPPRSVKRKVQAGISAENNGTHEQKVHEKGRRVSGAGSPKEQKPVERRQSVTTPAPKKTTTPEDTSYQPELVTSVGQLRNKGRHAIVNYLAGSFVEHLKTLLDSHKFELPENVSIEEYCEKLGIVIEYHIYLRFCKTGTLTKEYQSQSRSVGFNIKENDALSEELVQERLAPEKLAWMNSDQLAKKELRDFRMQVRIQSEKHHTLIHETGPRIRRTHKGEELVGEATENIASSDTILASTDIPRREHVDDSPSAKSPSVTIEQSTTPAATLPEHTPPGDVKHDSPRPQTANRPPPIDTSKAEASRKRKFSLEKVWSHVESPDTKKIIRQFPSRTPTSAISHMQDSKIDKDIDMLLRDNEDEEMEDAEPPYSPKSFNDHYSPPPDVGGSTWRGTIELEKICTLEASATLVGGPEYIQNEKWLDMVAPHVAINGRIPMERASEYLEGHYYSTTCAVVCASIKPHNATGQDAFNQVFEYFRTRNRYAVVGQNRHWCLKDLYIIPLEPNEKVPRWWVALRPPAAAVPEEKRDERLLLMTCVFYLTPKGYISNGNGRDGEMRKEDSVDTGHTNHTSAPSAQEYTPAPAQTPQLQHNHHGYYGYGNQYQPAPAPASADNAPKQQMYYANNTNNPSLVQHQQHYDQYYQQYHPQQPQSQSQPQPQGQSQTTPYQNPDQPNAHPAQQQQQGQYFHHPLLGHQYPQQPYPPQPSASPGLPPQQHPAPQPTTTEAPLLSMTEDLRKLVPGIGHEQLVQINKLLEENPHLQSDPDALVKAVDAILGKQEAN